MKIPGYTLHGDYYLSDTIIPNKTWEETCEIKEVITLPNGKKVIAHTLSEEELETIPQEERKMKGFWYCYWTSTLIGDGAWYVNNIGKLGYTNISYYGNTRLGFHKNEIKQFLDIE